MLFFYQWLQRIQILQGGAVKRYDFNKPQNFGAEMVYSNLNQVYISGNLYYT